LVWCFVQDNCGHEQDSDQVLKSILEEYFDWEEDRRRIKKPHKIKAMDIVNLKSRLKRLKSRFVIRMIMFFDFNKAVVMEKGDRDVLY
jgi:hypothetical protein